MGAWGTGVLEDDLAADVYGEFIDAYDDGAEPSAISQTLVEKYSECFESPDDYSSFWLALAKAQWECGSLQQDVVARVAEIVDSGKALAGWIHEEDQKKRAAALKRFFKSISLPRKQPRKRTKHRKPKLIFEPGTCLSISLRSGGFGAAVVLDVDTTSYKRAYYSLVGILQGRHPRPPEMEIFEARNWLYLTHHSFKNELGIIWCSSSTFTKEDAQRLTAIGVTQIRKDDPKVTPWGSGVGYAGWGYIEGQLNRQLQWDEKNQTS